MADATAATDNADSVKMDSSDASDTNLVLQFSGGSEELNASNGQKTSNDNMHAEYHVELEEDVQPVSSVKAIRTDHAEHMLSDDEYPKVLTTLETVKKPSISPQAEIELHLGDGDGDGNGDGVGDGEHVEEEGTILVEVCTDDGVSVDEKLIDNSDNEKKQLAEMQLGNLSTNNIRGRPRKSPKNSSDTETKTVIPKKITSIRSNSCSDAFRLDKVKRVKVSGLVGGPLMPKDEIEKAVASKLAASTATESKQNLPVKKPNRILNKIDTAIKTTPIKPIPVHSGGTIEIPRELLLSEAEIIPSPVILNHVNNSGKSIDNDELIAILEGDDDLKSTTNVEHFEVSIEDDGNLLAIAKNSQANLSKDEEREIAMQQMLNLPTKKKGRPRLDPSKRVPKVIKPTKKGSKGARAKPAAASELVSALVSDWSDSENKDDHETEIVIEINEATEPAQINIPTPRKRKSTPVEVPQPTFKRTRVIKKKIIWDPDAPETAINYASYAHTSGPGPAKKKLVKQGSPGDVSAPEQDAEPASPATASAKKKKTSEIDKLLGDEGAANMLNSLNQENNNTQSASTKPARKIVKPEPYDAIIHNLPRVKAARKEKEVIPQKQAQNTPIKKEAGTGLIAPKKRGPKPSASSSSSWDYVYSARPDDSMIIRRRSNSSYSSTASPNRSSMDLANAPPILDSDGPEANTVGPAEPPKKKAKNPKEKEKIFEFAKPIAKKLNKTEAESLAHQSILTDIRGKFNKAISGEAKRIAKIQTVAKDNGVPVNKIKTIDIKPIEAKDLDSILTSYSELTLKWHGNCVQLILSPKPAGNGGRYKNLLTIQVNNWLKAFLFFCFSVILVHYLLKKKISKHFYSS